MAALTCSNTGTDRIAERGLVHTQGHLLRGSQLFSLLASPGKQPLASVAIDPKGTRFISAGAEGTIRTWSVEGPKELSGFVLGIGEHIEGLAWHPGGKWWAAVISPDGLAPKEAKSRVLFVSATTGKLKTTLDVGGHQPFRCAFSPGGRLFAAGGGGTDRGGANRKPIA